MVQITVGSYLNGRTRRVSLTYEIMRNNLIPSQVVSQLNAIHSGANAAQIKKVPNFS